MPYLFRFLLICVLSLPVLAQDETGKGVGIPAGLKATLFADTGISPSPACLAVSAEGEVFIGVDLLGSLGKGPNKGRIVKVLDDDQDGKGDRHTVFAKVDNPRGLIPIGSKLYVLHTVIPESTGKLESMNLSVLEDQNRDGVADGPPKLLVSDVSPPLHNQRRGADHTTNGIHMGIDGWIYIAVGDFGIHGAKGTDGTELTMLGGGIVRVRPDGTEMEVYTHGLRNIYDVAIDPFMNLYTRGNTNDGGGWNIRFIHQIQSGEYGYPMLFKHFTDEILPALADLGGGSGTGALFFDEPGWPEAFNKVPMMCDWGKSQLIIHRVTPDGASFTQAPENFIKLHQIADADNDASGRLYLAAWNGAGFKGSDQKGYTVRITPSDWKYQAFPDVKKMSNLHLLKGIASKSAKTRHRCQQELITRKDDGAYAKLIGLANTDKLHLEGRVAAIFTAKQWKGAAAQPDLLKLVAVPAVREWALRALADRVPQNAQVPLEPFLAGLKDDNPRVQAAAAVGLGRLGRSEAAEALLAMAAKIPEPSLGPQESGVKPRYLSELVRGKTLVKIDIDISDMKSLVLGVTDGGDGDGNDHGAWFEPVLIAKDGKKVPLTELKWKSAKQGWGKTLVNQSCTGKPLESISGKKPAFGIGTHATSVITYANIKKKGFVRFQAHAGLSNSGDGNGSVRFLVHSDAGPLSGNDKQAEGPHATPNSDIVLPHLAVQALRRLDATSALVSGLSGPQKYGALWALKYRHEPAAVEGLIAARDASDDANFRHFAMETLLRLARKELPYDGSWWWSTRPDTHGPYYKAGPWDGTERVETYLRKDWEGADPASRIHLAREMKRNRVEIKGLDTSIATAQLPAAEEKTVDLSKIDMSLGEVGKMAIEDVLVALDTTKGDSKLGRQVFTRQGCVACHTLSSSEKLKGPFMGHIGSIMNRDQIAESILKPSATLSQGFATVSIEHKGGAAVGFVSAQSADEIELRDITGKVHKVKTADVKKRTELEVSMMPPGLANALSMKEFASLVQFLSERKQ